MPTITFVASCRQFSAWALLAGLALMSGWGCEETRTNRPEATPDGQLEGGGGPEDGVEPDQTQSEGGDPNDAASGEDTGNDSGSEGEIPDGGPRPTDADGGSTPTDTGAPDTSPDSGGDTGPDTDTAVSDAGLGLDPPPQRTCTLRFEHIPPSTVGTVHVAGAFNDWSLDAPKAWPLNANGAVHEGEFDVTAIPPGPYGYKFVYDENNWVFDSSNAMRVFDGDFENSKLYVPDCKVPLLELEEWSIQSESGTIIAQVAVRHGISSNTFSATPTVKHRGVVMPGAWDAESQRLRVELKNLEPGKHSLLFEASNAHGAAEPLWLPLWIESEPYDWRDAVMYFAFVDRFSASGSSPPAPSGANCPAASSITNWLGGDWVGLKQKIDEGYFDKLGVTAIWVTAPNDNPDTCMDGTLPGKKYTAYHGYFPASNTEAENRHGGMQALKDFVQAAHDRGIRVLVDLVLNHVHSSHPMVAAQPNWFNESCQCGGECDWNTKAEVCWFEPYLPDLNFEQREPVDAFAEMAEYWAREADLDGFRVDAVKHVHMHMLLTLRARLDRLGAAVGASLYTVGETFVGDWGGGGGSEELLIKKYIGPSLLDGQFDFPLYWKVVRAFARNEEGLDSLGGFLEVSQGYYGAEAVMGTFLGNHDVPRFISHAAGHIGDVWGNGAKEQGFDNPPPQPSDETPFARLRLAYTFLYCLTGIPLIYYGDEIGLAGAGDPDNRRMMMFQGWNTQQQSTFDHLGKLAKVRAALAPLRRGNTLELHSSADTLVFSRTLGNQAAVCAFNRSAAQSNLQVNAPAAWGSQAVKDHLSGSPVASSGGSLNLQIPARGALIVAP